MLASVVFMGAVVCSVGFMAWLVFFILNRGFNTTLEMQMERRRITRNYLIFGALLLAAAIALGVTFTQMAPPLPKPDLGPGMPQTVAPPPPTASMHKTLVAGGMVLSTVAFLLWLGTFALNRSFSASMRPAGAQRHGPIGQLCFGALLLGITIALVVAYVQPDPPVTAAEVPPESAAASSLQAPVEQAETAKEAVEAASGLNGDAPDEEVPVAE